MGRIKRTVSPPVREVDEVLLRIKEACDAGRITRGEQQSCNNWFNAQIKQLADDFDAYGQLKQSLMWSGKTTRTQKGFVMMRSTLVLVATLDHRTQIVTIIHLSWETTTVPLVHEDEE